MSEMIDKAAEVKAWSGAKREAMRRKYENTLCTLHKQHAEISIALFNTELAISSTQEYLDLLLEKCISSFCPRCGARHRDGETQICCM